MHIVVAENNIFAVRLQKRARECSLRFISLHGNHITIDIEFFYCGLKLHLERTAASHPHENKT